MVTAETTFSRKELLALKTPMTLFGIGWATYEEISQEVGANRSLHITFDRGTLTVMPITELHELLSSLLDRFVTLAGMTLKLNIVPTGQATMRSKQNLIGVEPDLSYFVSKAAEHEVKDYVPDELEMPPDIVVEIDVHHESEDKIDIYSRLGVSELWQFDGETMRMFRLTGNGEYSLVERSLELPVLTSEILTVFLKRGRSEKQQFALLSDFQAWLRNSE